MIKYDIYWSRKKIKYFELILFLIGICKDIKLLRYRNLILKKLEVFIRKIKIWINWLIVIDGVYLDFKCKVYFFLNILNVYDINFIKCICKYV